MRPLSWTRLLDVRVPLVLSRLAADAATALGLAKALGAGAEAALTPPGSSGSSTLRALLGSSFRLAASNLLLPSADVSILLTSLERQDSE